VRSLIVLRCLDLPLLSPTLPLLEEVQLGPAERVVFIGACVLSQVPLAHELQVIWLEVRV